MDTRSRYIDEEYRERLDEILTKHPDRSREWLDEQFVRICEDIESTTKDGTPMAAVRRIAFNQLTSRSGPL